MTLQQIVLDAVHTASAFALGSFEQVGTITCKTQKDFVTSVDTRAEEIIISTIRSKIPDASFYGEEGGRQGNGRFLFVIDPIDATTNYVKKIPLFDISVACYEEGKPLLGVVACPKLGELYTAQRRMGAYRNGKKIRVSQVEEISKAVVAYNRSNHPPEILESSKRILSQILDRALTLRVFGTGSLDYCYLAKGSFDACITPLAEPFHSAGYIIMEEAGAIVTDYEGNPHTLESKTIVAANPNLLPQVLALVQEL